MLRQLWKSLARLHLLSPMKKIILSAFLFVSSISLAQSGFSGIQEQSLHYMGMGAHADAYWDSVRISEGAPANVQTPVTVQGSCTLNKRVFGWHPYWVGTVYNNYQWNLLSDLCYFDYAVSPTTGNNTNSSYNWATSGAVTAAINNGVNVHICATLFSSHTTFLGSTTAQQTFINNIISDLQSRGGKGVNIDFEGMGASNSAAFTAFMQNLSTQLHAAIPGSELSMALYAVDWSNVFDIPNLTPYVDLFIIMGYDYYWSGSTTAGPDDPLYNFQTSYNYTLTRSITFYLAQGMPSSKLLLGLPYYGREWETTGSTIPSATTGNFSSSRTFNVIMNNASGYYSTPLYDPVSFTPYFSFQVSSAWRQCFWENPYSMKRRFDVVNQRNLGGIGIWALGYDDGYTDYWDAISQRFTNCAVVPCSDTIWDMGGPSRNYYNDEDYVTTIAPSGATQVSLTFSQFNMELNYDSLYIYDGPDDTYPLLGAYTGTNSPGTVTSTGGALSIKVHTDGNTVAAGFTAIWSCSIDNVNPVTTVNGPSSWVTQNFTATFTDTDNGGSGVAECFYQVADYPVEWDANNASGFSHSEFTNWIPSHWIGVTGTWTWSPGVQVQSDEALANTNCYSPLAQDLSDSYLYSWKGMINGTGNNRRAGLHFFCDSANLPNRGNGYFVWFRADQDMLEIYEVINDVFSLRASFPLIINTNQWYDWKVIYNRTTGKMSVYQDQIFVGSWTDSTPKMDGDYISLRSGNCNYQIDELNVYRSRSANSSVNVSVGSPSSDVRYESQMMSQAAQVSSIIIDSVGLFSNPSTQFFQVDWTVPDLSSIPLDGVTFPDIDTTTNLTQIQAWWFPATDTNSDIAEYRYCFGTTPGDSDFVAWTSNGLSLSVTVPATLVPGQWYYLGLRAVNGAGLVSLTDTSDGQVADLGLSVHEPIQGWTIYPNPATTELILTANSTALVEEVKIYDSNGKLALSVQVPMNASVNAPIKIDVTSLSAGRYTLVIYDGEMPAITTFIKQ